MSIVDGSCVTGSYKIDGVPVMDPHMPYKFELGTHGTWGKNINGDRTGYVTYNLKKLFWTYNAISGAYLNEILNIIFTKLESGVDSFTITSYIIGKGSITDTYYLGQPFSIKGISGGKYSLEIIWVQDKGKKTL